MSGTSGVRGGHDGHACGPIVDDEPVPTERSRVAVTEAGRRPCPALDGEGALRTARSSAPHAVVRDGLQVLRGPRYENPRPPVLVLVAARDALAHRLDGPEAGADDHVTEPFSPAGAVPRVRGPLRRCGAERTRTDDSVRGLGYVIRAGEDGR